MTRWQTASVRWLLHRLPRPISRFSLSLSVSLVERPYFLRATIIPFKLPSRATPRKTYNASKWPSGRTQQEQHGTSRPNKKPAAERTVCQRFRP